MGIMALVWRNISNSTTSKTHKNKVQRPSPASTQSCRCPVAQQGAHARPCVAQPAPGMGCNSRVTDCTEVSTLMAMEATMSPATAAGKD